MNEAIDPAQLRIDVPVTSRRPRRGLLRRALWLTAAAVAGLLAWQAFDHLEIPAPAQKSATGGGPTTVRVGTVTVAPMPIIINALGSVVPLATVTVRSQVSGKLIDIAFKEGQNVKSGDPLAHVDDRPFRATLAQAQALHDKDTAALAQAQLDLTRYQALNRQDSISHQQVDNQAFLVAQDKALIASDQAQIDAANLNISYAGIVAPISGRLGLRLVDPGNYVTAGDSTGIVVITQMDPISVVFSIAEDNLAAIAKRLGSGAHLAVEVRDRGDTKTLATGELQTYDNQIDSATGTIKLRALLPNADQTLFPNQFVNVRLTVDTLTDKPVAPAAGIQIGANGAFAYALNDDSTVSVRPVKTGPGAEGKIVVFSGLADGDKIVVDGVDRLREGAKVTVAPDAPDTAAPAKAAGDPGGGQSGQQKRKRDVQGATPAPSPSPQQ